MQVCEPDAGVYEQELKGHTDGLKPKHVLYDDSNLTPSAPCALFPENLCSIGAGTRPNNWPAVMCFSCRHVTVVYSTVYM